MEKAENLHLIAYNLHLGIVNDPIDLDQPMIVNVCNDPEVEIGKVLQHLKKNLEYYLNVLLDDLVDLGLSENESEKAIILSEDELYQVAEMAYNYTASGEKQL